MPPRVCYFMDNDIGSWYYGKNHPMKPHRIAMTNNLVLAYGLHHKMEVFRPRFATAEEMKEFHEADYIDFLRRISPKNQTQFREQLKTFNVGVSTGDCPIMEDLFEYCQRYTGASIDGARKLIHGTADIAINWAGGLHHAKKTQASGFCYINDIVLAIIEMLKFYPRVMYVDIDVHHGDGVEHAFYQTDRVLTLSFHKFGDGFFPGTGNVFEMGAGRGEYYAVNVPLKSGVCDSNYEKVFVPIVRKAVSTYQPSAIVLQCGADALAHDRLGPFNLTTNGYGKCVKFVKSFGLPMLVLGGGGYNIRNVARCWVNNTAILLEEKLEAKMPYHDYSQYYEPEHDLHIKKSARQDENTKKYLDAVKLKVIGNLRNLTAAPSVQMQEIPSSRDLDLALKERDSDDDTPLSDKMEAQGEFYDGDGDNDGEESHIISNSRNATEAGSDDK